MVGMPAEIVGLRSLPDLVAVFVQIHLIPVHIGIYARSIFEGGIFRGERRILRIIGMAIPTIGTIMIDIVPGAGA